MKDTLIKMKNNSQGNNSRVDKAKNQINDLEHKEAENNQSEQKEKIIQENENSVSSLWDNFCTVGVPEEEKKQEIGNAFKKIVKENFPNLVKEIDMQVQES